MDSTDPLEHWIGRRMNDHEKYLFDLRGYIVVKNALTAGQVEDLSARLEAHRKAKGRLGSDRTIFGADAGPAWSAPSLLEWGGTYIDLIDLPTIAPYLETLLGTGYRLDHDYINVINAEHPSQLYLHGGGQGAGGPRDVVGPTDGGQCFYRYNNGQFFNGLLTVAFELNDVTASSGGFACVAGSHKVNFALPPEWRISKKQADIPPCVHRVTAQAGDAIIFTEACAHGTVPWEGGDERRTVFYKYCPHAVAWGPCYYNADHYGDPDRRTNVRSCTRQAPSGHTIARWRSGSERRPNRRSWRGCARKWPN